MKNSKKNWIQSAIKRPGAFTAKAKSRNLTVSKFKNLVTKNPDKYSDRTVRQANLAATLAKFATGGQQYSLPVSSNSTTTNLMGLGDPAIVGRNMLDSQQKLRAAKQEVLDQQKADAEAAEQASKQAAQSGYSQGMGQLKSGLQSANNALQISQGTANAAQVAKASKDTGELLGNLSSYGSKAATAKDIAKAAGPGLLGAGLSLAGTGVQRVSDDKDATTMNFGETTGTLMKGAGTGLGAAGALTALAPALAIPGIGWAAAGIGALGYGAHALIQRNKARKEKAKEEAENEKMQNELSQGQTDAFNTAFTKTGSDMGFNVGSSMTNSYLPGQQQMYKRGGEMIKRADGSYSQRGLWDNIRANKGSGKKPTKQMLEQEKKIKAEMMAGGQALKGGAMLPMSNTAVEFVGNKHNKGGIMLDKQTEVEGGETMDKVMFKQGGAQDYIFSDYLKLGGKTFARRHKDLVKSRAPRAEIQRLAKLQELVAQNKGRDENGPRDPDKIAFAQAGGVRKYESGDTPATTTASNTPPPEPAFNPWAPSLTTTFFQQGIKGIDKETTIGGPSTGNLYGTAWGKHYSQHPLFLENSEKFYDEVYTPGVQEYFANNPDQAYEQLRRMAEGTDANADNFRKMLYVNGKMRPKDEALQIAQYLATDKNVGSFHMLLPPPEKPEDEIPEEGDKPDIPGGGEKPGDIPGDTPDPEPEPKPRKFRPELLSLLGLAGLGVPVKDPYPKARLAGTTNVRNANLPRINLNAERAANAAQTTAINRAIMGQGAGPGGISAMLAANDAARNQNLNIANQEARANKELMGQEASMNANIAMQNAQMGQQAAMFNAQQLQQRDINQYDQRLLNRQLRADTLTGVGRDFMSYRAQERLANAVDDTGSYMRFVAENMDIFKKAEEEAKKNAQTTQSTQNTKNTQSPQVTTTKNKFGGYIKKVNSVKRKRK